MKPVRPRDAATLVVLDPVDGAPAQTRVLMGRRAPKHDFLPNVFVFPGGRVDPTDSDAPLHNRLDPDVARKIGGHSSRASRASRASGTSRAHMLATAAIRETFEETGLALLDPIGDAASIILPRRPEPGEGHAAEWPGPGLAPRYHVLDYIGRAITPSVSPKRFDTHFFAAHASHAQGEVLGNGELLDLDWYPIADALKLPLIDVTEFILNHVSELLRSGAPVGPGFCPSAPFYSWRAGGWTVR